MKQCTKCGKLQPDTEFWMDRRRGQRKTRCKSCQRRYQREWRTRHPEVEKRRYWNNRDSERERHLKRKYGINFADYAVMLTRQRGACAVCGRPEPKNRMLDVDHDHATGAVRGLLCTSCNRMIGHAHDSPDRLMSAANYLSSRKSRRSLLRRTLKRVRKRKRHR